MPADFDAYHKWLGISPREQPPNRYRLLGIDLFEDDKEVIDAAANRQMSHLQELAAAGPDVEVAQKLLNEIAAARVCLLDVGEKAAYDAALKHSQPRPRAMPAARRASVGHPAVPPRVAIVQQPPADKVGRAVSLTPGVDVTQRRPPAAAPSTLHRSKKLMAFVVALAAAAVVSGAVLAVFVFRQPGNRSSLGISAVPGNAVQGNDIVAASERDKDSIRPPTSAGTDGEKEAKKPPDDTEEDWLPKLTHQKNDSPPPDVKQNPPPPSKTDPLVPARAALAAGKIPEFIQHLQTYLNGDPQSPWKGEAEEMLRQAQLATSDDEIKKILLQQVNKLTDQQFEEVAARKRPLEFKPPVSHPILVQAFSEGVNRHLPGIMQQRYDRRGQPPEMLKDNPPPKDTSPPKDTPPPKDALAAKPPDGKHPEPPKTAPSRPTEPAELLAAEGLLTQGNRWILADLEDDLSVALKDVVSLSKQLTDAQRRITRTEREQLAQAERWVAEEEAKVKAAYDQWQQQGAISESEAAKLKKHEAKVKERRTQVDAARGKVTAADDEMLRTLEQLRQALQELGKSIDLVQSKYDQLSEDAEVLAAIEKLGGSLKVPKTKLKAARLKLQKTENMVAGQDD